MSQDEHLPEAICPKCGHGGGVLRFARRETVDVRGLEFEVEKILRRCEACGAEFENTKDPDWRVEGYEKYRKSKGMLSPDQIKGWRRAYDLKQAEVTALLGWGEVTLGRYENGSLQTEAHDKRLAELMDPNHLAAMLATHPEAVPVERRRDILARIRQAQGLLSPEDVLVIRLRYGLSEEEMERLMAVPEGTWGRWERGEEIQGKAADMLMREMAEHPDVVRSLLKRSGLESAAAQRVLHRIDEDVERRVAEAITRRFGALEGIDVQELVRVASDEIRKAQPVILAGMGRAAA
jgi:putative zinc finger/helix-turn-helix YgiT family protein